MTAAVANYLSRVPVARLGVIGAVACAAWAVALLAVSAHVPADWLGGLGGGIAAETRAAAVFSVVVAVWMVGVAVRSR